MTTWILFDVDGVLNASLAGGSHPSVAESRSFAMVDSLGNGTWPIRWNTKIVDSLKRIVARPDVQPMWATTWRDSANYGIRPALGMSDEPWPVLHPKLDPAERTTFPSIYWKMDAVKRLVESGDWEEGDRIIHIDDEFWIEPAGDMDDYFEWAKDNGYLIVGPDPQYGITPATLTQIEDYLGPVA